MQDYIEGPGIISLITVRGVISDLQWHVRSGRCKWSTALRSPYVTFGKLSSQDGAEGWLHAGEVPYLHLYATAPPCRTGTPTNGGKHAKKSSIVLRT